MSTSNMNKSDYHQSFKSGVNLNRNLNFNLFFTCARMINSFVSVFNNKTAAIGVPARAMQGADIYYTSDAKHHASKRLSGRPDGADNGRMSWCRISSN
jgi:hypothetical protein